MGCFLKTICFVVVFCACYDGTNSLKNVHVKIPRAIVSGKNVTLYCLYDLEGANLYSVKWYRKNNEFFRYVPKEKPMKKTFKMKGIHVLEALCNNTQIVLQNVTLNLTGLYSCEVSADQPKFSTGIKSFNLQVVNLPKSLPQINGLKTRYLIGDKIQINCTSIGDSKLNLTWFINEKIVNNTTNNYTEKMTFSQLNLTLTKQNFINNKLKIRCSATLYDVYHKSTEKSVILKNNNLNKFKYDLSNNFIHDEHKINWEITEIAQKSLDKNWLKKTNRCSKVVKSVFLLVYGVIFCILL